MSQCKGPALQLWGGVGDTMRLPEGGVAWHLCSMAMGWGLLISCGFGDLAKVTIFKISTYPHL